MRNLLEKIRIYMFWTQGEMVFQAIAIILLACWLIGMNEGF